MPRAALLVALATALAGCLDDSAPDTPPTERASTDAATEAALFTNFTGKLTGLPVQPATQDFPLDVPTGAVEVAATLAWTSPAADLRLLLLDPAGEPVETGFKESGTQRSAATLDPPASGAWTLRVTAARALDEPFTVAARVLLVVPLHNVLADEFEVGGAELFKEINVIMEADASFAWTFTSTAPIHYDIHSHEDGETTYHEKGTAQGGEGNFTAPKRQIYSLLFAPPDAGESAAPPTPATVSYRMDGEFRVHSHSQ